MGDWKEKEVCVSVMETQATVQWRIIGFASMEKNSLILFTSPTFQFLGASWSLCIKHNPSGLKDLFLIDVERISSNSSRHNLKLKFYFKNSFGKDFHVFKYKEEISRSVHYTKQVTFLENMKNEKLKKLITQNNELTFCLEIMDTKELKENEKTTSPPACVLYSDFSSKIDLFSPNVRGRVAGLAKDIESALDSSLFSDVTLKSDNETFPAHRVVLASRSKVFAAMLDAEMKEKQEGVVNLIDMEPDTVRGMLRFMYSGTAPEMTQDEAIRMYAAADCYDLQELKDACRACILIHLTEENLCEVAVFANLQSDTLIMKGVEDFFGENIPAVLTSTKWKEFALKDPAVYSELVEAVLFDKADEMAYNSVQE